MKTIITAKSKRTGATTFHSVTPGKLTFREVSQILTAWYVDITEEDVTVSQA